VTDSPRRWSVSRRLGWTAPAALAFIPANSFFFFEVQPMAATAKSRPFTLHLEDLERRENPVSNFLVSGAAPGGLPLVEVQRPDGTLLARFSAFEDSFRGGVRATAAELDGNPNTLEVVAVAGPGGGSAVKVYQIDLNTGAQTPLGAFFAFEPSFRGGLHVTAGNITAPGDRQEIIVSSDVSGGPRVRAFNLINGQITPAAGPLSDFFAFDPSFTGGVRLAAGELDGNTQDGDELVVAAGPFGGPRVKVLRSDGATLADYFAFRPDFLGGVQVGIQNTGTVGRVTIDAQPNDFSQRNPDLNAAAISVQQPTTTTTTTTAGVVPNGVTTGIGTTELTSGNSFAGLPTGLGTTGVIPGLPTTGLATNQLTGVGTTANVFNPTAQGMLGAGNTGVISPHGFSPLGVGTTAQGSGFTTAGFTPTTTQGAGFTTVGAVAPTTLGTGFSTTGVSPSTTQGAGFGTASTVTTNGLGVGFPGFGATAGQVGISPNTSITSAFGGTGIGVSTGTTAGLLGIFGDPGPLNPFPTLRTPAFTGQVLVP
jgi:hypothetical protein